MNDTFKVLCKRSTPQVSFWRNSLKVTNVIHDLWKGLQEIHPATQIFHEMSGMIFVLEELNALESIYIPVSPLKRKLLIPFY